jgi:hypothetical protein
VGAGLLAANWEPETKTICADVPMIENVKKVAGGADGANRNMEVVPQGDLAQ